MLMMEVLKPLFSTLGNLFCGKCSCFDDTTPALLKGENRTPWSKQEMSAFICHLFFKRTLDFGKVWGVLSPIVSVLLRERWGPREINALLDIIEHLLPPVASSVLLKRKIKLKNSYCAGSWNTLLETEIGFGMNILLSDPSVPTEASNENSLIAVPCQVMPPCSNKPGINSSLVPAHSLCSHCSAVSSQCCSLFLCNYCLH